MLLLAWDLPQVLHRKNTVLSKATRHRTPTLKVSSIKGMDAAPG